jgi:FkbM family methyltransferase
LPGYPLSLTFPAGKHLNLYLRRSIRYEPHLLAQVERRLRPGDVAFDVGANIGIYTVLAAHLAGPSGAVYAFEPDPQNVRYLRGNVAANGLGNVQLFDAAVSCVEGESTLYQDTTTTRTSSLLPDAWSPDPAPRIPLTVRTLVLDQFLPALDRLDFIKIDVEGHEYEVLLGAQALLARFRPTLLAEVTRANRPRVHELLGGLGYSLLDPLTGAEVSETDEVSNLLCSCEPVPGHRSPVAGAMRR